MAFFRRAAAQAGRFAGPAAAVVATAAGAVAFTSGEDHIPAPSYPWSHKGPFSSYDAASLRRGHQVYTQVCASCHSLNLVHYRELVGVCYTEEEAKKLAEDITVVDGPNDAGEMFDRPGKLSDRLPAPYKNDEQARSINNGALPPDLSLLIKARGAHEDYMFALLTGYRDAPEGVTCAEGQYYNPYFPGAKIGMPKQITDGCVDYADGTPATASQMAKDVSVFLAWASEPKQDEIKRGGMKWMLVLTTMAVLTGFYKRYRWSPLKNRKIQYTD